MAESKETARRWHGERLPNCDRLGSLIGSEDTPSAIQAQRLASRFGLPPAIAGVVARHAFGEVAA